MTMNVSINEIYASFLFGDGFKVFVFEAVGKNVIKIVSIILL